MEEPLKKIELINDIKERLLRYGHVNNANLAEEIARRWFRNKAE